MKNRFAIAAILAKANLGFRVAPEEYTSSGVSSIEDAVIKLFSSLIEDDDMYDMFLQEAIHQYDLIKNLTEEELKRIVGDA